MTIRALVFAVVSAGAVAGCGPKPGGKVLATAMVYQAAKPAVAASADSPATAATPAAWVPLVDYRSPGQTGGGPDFDEITGIQPPEEKEPEEPTPVATPAPTPAAIATPAAPVAAPVVPVKAATPAKTPAKTPATPAPKK